MNCTLPGVRIVPVGERAAYVQLGADYVVFVCRGDACTISGFIDSVPIYAEVDTLFRVKRLYVGCAERKIAELPGALAELYCLFKSLIIAETFSPI